MVAGNVSRVLRNPGRVVVGPTNLGNAYPHGGTEVGKTNACVLTPVHAPPFHVRSEGLGETTNILEPANDYVFTFFLRGWDDDAVQQFRGGGYAAGGTTRHAVWSEPGSTNATPGATALTREKIVLYVPDDTIHNLAVLIYRGVPDWTEGAELAFQRGSELGLPISLYAIRDTNNNSISVGRFADLSLS